MGQIFVPSAPPSIFLTPTDRLIATNADGGIAPSPATDHIILLGENAGRSLATGDVIALGFNAAAGGLTANQRGTVVVGSGSLPVQAAGGASGPFIVIGYNNLQLLNNPVAGDFIVIGANCANHLITGAGMQSNVLIGDNVLENAGQGNAGAANVQQNVIIGSNAARGLADPRNCAGSVIIGYGACSNWGNVASGTISSNVVIGQSAASILGQVSTSQQNVIIGAGAGSNLENGERNVIIGASANSADSDGSNNVYIGCTASGSGDLNVIIGSFNQSTVGSRNVCLGAGAIDSVGAINDKLVVQTSFAARRTLLFGDFSTSCLIVGQSTNGVDRDMPGTNILKIVNGARDGGLTAPVGGGFFYASGGELHWVSSGNYDYALTGAGQIFTVATLPAAPAGTRAFVTDALAPAFGAAVAGGGAVFTTVFRNNAAAWIVG